MFNLDVANEKLEKFRDLLNENNVASGILKTKDSVTTLKFKTQEELDKAQEVLKTI
jgi:hypothetical protein